MKPTCEEVRRLRAREAVGLLTAREFAALDRHTESCSACAERHRQDDPLALFQALAAERQPASFWAGLWSGVRVGVQEEGSLGPLEGLSLLRPSYRAALAALLILGVGLLALVTFELPGTEEPRLSAEVVPASALGPLTPGAVQMPTVESIESPGARIYDLKLFGEGDEVTELVLIFDEEIEL